MAEKRHRILHLIESEGVYGAENVIMNLSREMIAHEKYEPLRKLKEEL